MTGFFGVRRDAVDLERLRPRGFKILLDILARHDLLVREVPFFFGERYAGDSKASWRNGMQFLVQMILLRVQVSPPTAQTRDHLSTTMIEAA